MAATSIGLLLMNRSRKKASSSPPKEKEKEKEEVEKTVYLCANALNNCTDWYVFKLSSQDCAKKKKKRGRGGKQKVPLYIKPILRNMPLPWQSCFVALGSTICCISSSVVEYSSSSDVLSWDTATSLQWQPFPSMNLKRKGCFSDAVTADGKIYVFGGGVETMDDDDERFVCEVFDPTKNKWEPINQSPSPQQLTFLRSALLDDLFALYDDSSCRIILGSRLSDDHDDGFLLTYGVRDGLWTTLPTLPQKFSAGSSDIFMTRPAFFDKTLYWIEIHEDTLHDSGVYAYDLDLQMLFYGTIIGVHPFFWDSQSYTMQFIHFRGDEFYLIWQSHFSYESQKLVRCERLRIFKNQKQASLTAYVLSTKTYSFETQAYGIGTVVL